MGGNAFTSFGAVGAVGGWVELGRTKLGSSGDDITVSSLANKRYYKILWYTLHSGSFTQQSIRAGNSTIDVGSNYTTRESIGGAADATRVSQTSMLVQAEGNDVDYPAFGVGYIANLPNKEKLMIHHTVGENNTGAASTPYRSEVVGKWTNTSNVIDILQNHNGGGGSYATGSEMVVLGWDPADVHTNNFWEELDTDTGASIDLSFTGKKYLWLQFYLKATGGTLNPRMRVGNTSVDTGSTIALRSNSNGGTDATATNQTFIDVLGITLQSGESLFGNYFIINNAANEKLFIGHTVSNNGSGAGNAPDRFEFTGKWANTVDLMDVLQITKNDGTGTQDTTSFAKIWGSN